MLLKGPGAQGTRGPMGYPLLKSLSTSWLLHGSALSISEKPLPHSSSLNRAGHSPMDYGGGSYISLLILYSFNNNLKTYNKKINKQLFAYMPCEVSILALKAGSATLLFIVKCCVQSILHQVQGTFWNSYSNLIRILFCGPGQPWLFRQDTIWFIPWLSLHFSSHQRVAFREPFTRDLIPGSNHFVFPACRSASARVDGQ